MMGHALAVYGAVALLVAASAGPVLAGVRDASLADFAALDEPRTLNEFPFLKAVESYLPPIVVDWLIIRPDPSLQIPDGVQYRLDAGGRVILVWPDGCEETEEQYRSGSLCERPAEPDCRAEPEAEGCPPLPEPCEGTRAPDGTCVLEPACPETSNATLPDGCHEEEVEPEPPCPPGQAPTRDDDCIPIVTHELAPPVRMEGGTANVVYRTVPLRAAYANLSLEITFEGIPAPEWKVTMYNVAGQRLCWVLASDPEQQTCEILQPGSLQSGNRTYHDDGAMAPLPAEDLTLLVEYSPGPGASKSLEVRVFGKPAEYDAS